MKKIALLAMTVILAGTLWGCAGGEEADKTAPTISEVSASDITETSATITWTTDEPATGEVEYGLTTSYGSTATSPIDAFVTNHSVPLSGLDENTTYHYRVKSKDESDNEAVSGDYTFTTAAPPSEVPDQTSNVSPADEASDIGLTPTLTSSAFSDPDAGDTHAASQWQVTTTSSDYSSPVFDSGTDTVNLTSITIPSGTLDNATTYYWRVRHQDDNDAWSDYSSETSFTTLIFPDENLEAAVREAIGKPEGPLCVTDIEGLLELDASERNIIDIRGLEYCANLTVLHLYGNEISDVSSLEDLTSLTALWLYRNQISNTAPLSNLTTLRTLSLADNQLLEVSPLSNLISLRYLSLRDNQISDISALGNLTTLTQLYLWNNQIADISPLANLTNLITLYLNDNQISDITTLSNLTSLTELVLGRNQISDVSSLENLTSLTVLCLDGNYISDISPLSGLTDLTKLDVEGNEISDVSSLEDLTSLTWLHLGENQVSDISPLSNLTNLTVLWLRENQIGDINPLSNLTGLTELLLDVNQITDISPLENLTSLGLLQLGNNQISDIEPLVANSGLSDGDTVDLTDNPLSAESIDVYIPQLEARGVTVVYDAPLDGQLPTLQLGDRWVWTYVMDEITRTLTEEVIGEETVDGRDCYVIDMSFDPLFTWTYDDVVCSSTSMKHWADKATGLLSVKSESSYSCNGTDYTNTTTHSYDPWTSLFPLEVGKVVETEKTSIQYSDGSQVGEPVVTTERYIIVSQENVTVAAGTFGCWKMTMYDSATEVTQTMWYSDQVKSVVKMIDAEGNTVMELQSYSVS